MMMDRAVQPPGKSMPCGNDPVKFAEEMLWPEVWMRLSSIVAIPGQKAAPIF